MNILNSEFAGWIILIGFFATILIASGIGYYRATVEADVKEKRMLAIYETMMANAWRGGYELGAADQLTPPTERMFRENPFITW